MGDLKLGKIPLEGITLEKMDCHSDKHMRVVGTMRDEAAVEMCYDVQNEFDAQKKGAVTFGNHYLVRDNNKYFGYMYISDDYDGERILAYIVEETVRGKGLGKVMLTSVSNYLFEHCDTSVLKLYINKENVPGIGLAVGCGFEKTDVTDGILYGYDKKR